MNSGLSTLLSPGEAKCEKMNLTVSRSEEEASHCPIRNLILGKRNKTQGEAARRLTQLRLAFRHLAQTFMFDHLF